MAAWVRHDHQSIENHHVLKSFFQGRSDRVRSRSQKPFGALLLVSGLPLFETCFHPPSTLFLPLQHQFSVLSSSIPSFLSPENVSASKRIAYVAHGKTECMGKSLSAGLGWSHNPLHIMHCIRQLPRGPLVGVQSNFPQKHHIRHNCQGMEVAKCHLHMGAEFLAPVMMPRDWDSLFYNSGKGGQQELLRRLKPIPLSLSHFLCLSLSSVPVHPCARKRLYPS